MNSGRIARSEGWTFSRGPSLQGKRCSATNSVSILRYLALFGAAVLLPACLFPPNARPTPEFRPSESLAAIFGRIEHRCPSGQHAGRVLVDPYKGPDSLPKGFGPSFAFTSADAQGYFALSLPPGHYALTSIAYPDQTNGILGASVEWGRYFDDKTSSITTVLRACLDAGRLCAFVKSIPPPQFDVVSSQITYIGTMRLSCEGDVRRFTIVDDSAAAYVWSRESYPNAPQPVTGLAQTIELTMLPENYRNGSEPPRDL